MNRSLKTFGLSLVIVAVAVNLRADPLAVQFLNRQYSTGVSSRTQLPISPEPPYFSSTNFSRTLSGPAPISDALHHQTFGTLEATASADLLHVSTFTSTFAASDHGDYSLESVGASAKTALTFAPLTSGVFTIDLNFIGQLNWWYASGYVSLLDVTANQTLWQYGCGSLDYGFWGTTSGNSVQVPISVATGFVATHTYELTLYAETHANGDNELFQINVAGLFDPQSVPEPTSLSLVALGAMTCLTLRRRRVVAAR